MLSIKKEREKREKGCRGSVTISNLIDQIELYVAPFAQTINGRGQQILLPISAPTMIPRDANPVTLLSPATLR